MDTTINEATASEVVTEVDSSTGSDFDFDVFAGFDEPVSDITIVPDSVVEPSSDSSFDESPDEAPSATETEPQVEAAPTIEPDAKPQKLNFRAKIDHNEQEIELSPDDLPTIYQKSVNADRAAKRAETAQAEADKLRAELYDLAATARAALPDIKGETSTEILEAIKSGLLDSAKRTKLGRMAKGTDPELAGYVIDQQLKDGKAEAMKLFEAGKSAPDVQTASDADAEPQSAATSQPSALPSKEQFSQDLLALLRERPDIQGSTLPQEVLESYLRGESLSKAYLMYESKSAAAEIQRLREQNSVLQQNQASAKRAPIHKGVSGHGNNKQTEDPDFAGWDDTPW